MAAVGGRVLSGKNRGRIAGGRMTADGKVFYEGLPKDFGGYLHRAELSQDAEALDLRCIRIRSADRELFEKIVGVPYTEVVRGPEQQPVFDSSTLPAGADIRLLSLQLSEALRKRGRLLYLPEYPEKSKWDSTISCCWLNGGWDYSGVYAEELRMKNGCVYRGCALLSNGADDVETVHAIKTIEDCLWKQYPQY